MENRRTQITLGKHKYVLQIKSFNHGFILCLLNPGPETTKKKHPETLNERKYHKGT